MSTSIKGCFTDYSSLLACRGVGASLPCTISLNAVQCLTGVVFTLNPKPQTLNYKP